MTMKSSILSLSLTVALAGICGTAFAQASATDPATALPAITPPAAGTKLAADDAKFLEIAAKSGIAEIQDGNLASQKGQSDDVKELAKKIVADHNAANNQLKELASSYGVTLPTNPADPDLLEHQRLSTLHGVDFDKAYVEDEVKDHQSAIELFEKESTSGQDPTLKQFASNVLPILKDHLKAAKALQPEGAPAAADVPAAPAPGDTPAASPAPEPQPAAPAAPAVPDPAPAAPAGQ